MRVSFKQIIYMIFDVCFTFFRCVPSSDHAAAMHCHEAVMHYHAAVMHHHATMCSKSVQASLIKAANSSVLYRAVEKTCSCIYPSVSRNVKGTIKCGKKFFTTIKINLVFWEFYFIFCRA